MDKPGSAETIQVVQLHIHFYKDFTMRLQYMHVMKQKRHTIGFNNHVGCGGSDFSFPLTARITQKPNLPVWTISYCAVCLISSLFSHSNMILAS